MSTFNSEGMGPVAVEVSTRKETLLHTLTLGYNNGGTGTVSAHEFTLLYQQFPSLDRNYSLDQQKHMPNATMA